MTEEDAKAWVSTQYGDKAVDKLSMLAGLVEAESRHQNLIAASTIRHLWSRHIADSAQLVPLARGAPDGTWIDIGTGAGFPGLVTAILSGRRTLLVEPRKRRVDFLIVAIEALGLANVDVEPLKVERLTIPATVISARAVARVGALLKSAAQCSSNGTVWLLPKGRSALEEVAEAKRSWHGVFHVEHSVTDAGSLIVVANKVSPR